MDASSSSSSELPAGRIRKRRYSTARIQPTRIKKVMQSDEDIGRMIASVPVAIGSVMEHFTEKLLEAASSVMHYSTSKTLSPQHLYTAISQTPHFGFMMPLVKNIGPAPTNSILMKQDYQTFGLSTITEEPDHLPDHYHEMKDMKPVTASVSASSSSSDEGVKRKRGRPKKDPQAAAAANNSSSMNKQHSNTLSKQVKTSNGVIERNPERDRELMPPPPLIRKFQSNSIPISSPVVSSQATDTQPQQQTDAISA